MTPSSVMVLTALFATAGTKYTIWLLPVATLTAAGLPARHVGGDTEPHPIPAPPGDQLTVMAVVPGGTVGVGVAVAVAVGVGVAVGVEVAVAVGVGVAVAVVVMVPVAVVVGAGVPAG